MTTTDALLLDGHFAPITNVIGFIEAPLDDCLDPFARIVAKRLGVEPATLATETVDGSIAAALDRLLPIHHGVVGNRFLLVPTTSTWTAFFENSATGDLRPVVGELPDELNCRTAAVYTVPGDDGFDVLGFSVAAPGRAGMLDAVRVLVRNRVDGRMDTQTYGDPLVGEPIDPTTFGPADLVAVLANLDIRAFAADFYLPPGAPAVVLQVQHPVDTPATGE